VATIPKWITITINTEELDYAPVGGPSFEPPKIENRAQLLAAFDKGSAEARAAVRRALEIQNAFREAQELLRTLEQ